MCDVRGVLCTGTYLRSCKTSLALNIVMSDVVAAGIMMIGVREPVNTTTNVINSRMDYNLLLGYIFKSDYRDMTWGGIWEVV